MEVKNKLRLKRLCRVLKDHNNTIEYNKVLPRLKFKICKIWITNGSVLFLMPMVNNETNYIEVDDLNYEELEEIIIDLENILAS